ncbi:MAG: hypothetical protein R6W06_15480 [Prochlorococcaceae cyanobacterium]
MMKAEAEERITGSHSDSMLKLAARERAKALQNSTLPAPIAATIRPDMT